MLNNLKQKLISAKNYIFFNLGIYKIHLMTLDASKSLKNKIEKHIKLKDLFGNSKLFVDHDLKKLDDLYPKKKSKYDFTHMNEPLSKEALDLLKIDGENFPKVVDLNKIFVNSNLFPIQKDVKKTTDKNYIDNERKSAKEINPDTNGVFFRKPSNEPL